jgi:hypothetical protein
MKNPRGGPQMGPMSHGSPSENITQQISVRQKATHANGTARHNIEGLHPGFKPLFQFFQTVDAEQFPQPIPARILAQEPFTKVEHDLGT